MRYLAYGIDSSNLESGDSSIAVAECSQKLTNSSIPVTSIDRRLMMIAAAGLRFISSKIDCLASVCRLLFISLWLVSTASWSAIVDPQIERAYFVDKDAAFDVGTIEQAPFKPYAKRLNIGYQLAPIWLRLRLTPAAQSPESTANSSSGHLVLRVGPHDTNQIEVYEFSEGQWLTQTAGDFFPARDTWCADDYFCFRLRDHSSTPKTIYLKIQTYNFLMFDSEVLSIENLAEASSSRMKRIAASLTMAVFMLAIGLYWLTQHRSKLTVVYFVFQIFVLGYLLSIYGFPSRWFPDLPVAVVDALPHLLFMLRTFLLSLAIYVVIRPYCDEPLYPKIVFSLLAICIGNFIAFNVGFKTLAIQLNLVVFSIQPTIHLYGLIKSKGMVKNVKTLLYAGYAVYCVLVAGSIIPALLVDDIGTFEGSVQNITDWRLNGTIVGFFVILLIKFEEDYREKLKIEKYNQLQLDAFEAKSSAALLADRNTLIDLLTHDLKNPLGTITFASNALREQVKHDPSAAKRLTNIDLSVTRMNNLIEHVALSTRVDRYHAPSSHLLSPADELIDELIENHPERERLDISVDEQSIFKADRDMLSVIFGNLIDNAYKYGHAVGKIKIDVKRERHLISKEQALSGESNSPQEVLHFRVSNPIGIYGAPDEDRVFERYYRPTSSMSLPGMGLGLSLVKAAAAKIGATVEYLHDEETITFSVKVPN
jgi:signal transduction histidine kinase